MNTKKIYETPEVWVYETKIGAIICQSDGITGNDFEDSGEFIF